MAIIVEKIAFVLLSVVVSDLGKFMSGGEPRLVDVDIEAFCARLKVPVILDFEVKHTYKCPRAYRSRLYSDTSSVGTVLVLR